MLKDKTSNNNGGPSTLCESNDNKSVQFNPRVSLFNGARDTTPIDYCLYDVLAMIKEPDSDHSKKLKELENLRSEWKICDAALKLEQAATTTRQEGSASDEKEEGKKELTEVAKREKETKRICKDKKLSLPMASFSGEFAYRAAENLTQHSGLVVIDIDGIQTTAKLEFLKGLITHDPLCHFVFTSPSGNGLKVGVRVAIDNVTDPVAISGALNSRGKHLGNGDHNKIYEAVMDKFEKDYSEHMPIQAVDAACKDVVRGCFLSYDPNIFINKGSEVFHKQEVIIHPAITSYDCLSVNNNDNNTDTSYQAHLHLQNPKDVAEMLKYIDKGDPHRTEEVWMKTVGALNASTMTDQEKRDLLINWRSDKFDYDSTEEVEGKLRYLKNHFAVLVNYAKAGGYVVRPDPDNLSSPASSSSTKRALPTWSWSDDFVAKELPTPDELVKGILHRGSKLVLGGASKAGKTWVLLDLAISVSSGHHWLGFPTIKSKVLYLNLEIQDKFMQGRIAKVKEAKGLKATPNLAIWNLRGHAADIVKLSADIINAAKAEGFALIVVDPIYKVMGDRVENSTEGVAAVMNELEKIAVEGDAAIVFGSHYSKGNQAGKDALDRIGGSGVFARDPDAILTFTSHEEENAFAVDVTLRNFAPVAPFVVRWNYPLMHPDCSLDAKNLKQVLKGSEKKFLIESTIAVLGTSSMTREEWKKAAMDITKMGAATFERHFKEAMASKLVDKDCRTNLFTKVN